MGRLLEGFGVGIISYTVKLKPMKSQLSNSHLIFQLLRVLNFSIAVGPHVHSRDITSELERELGLSESGFLISHYPNTLVNVMLSIIKF